MGEPVEWMDDGSPRSRRFDDRYRSSAGGLAQATTVFLAGCGLPHRWRGHERFTVLETGFGLGLNFLTTWAAWAADAERSGCLHFVSVEAYPVSVPDILRSAQMAAPPSGSDAGLMRRVQALAQELAQVWRDLAPGLHVFHFAQGRVQLTLAVGQAQRMLQSLDCRADAVYLDGFSPARNPDMWSLQTLQGVSLHCRAGTTLATYTVARSVRTRLEGLGFRVEKCAGLAPKRDCLKAVFLPQA